MKNYIAIALFSAGVLLAGNALAAHNGANRVSEVNVKEQSVNPSNVAARDQQRMDDTQKSVDSNMPQDASKDMKSAMSQDDTDKNAKAAAEQSKKASTKQHAKAKAKHKKPAKRNHKKVAANTCLGCINH